MSIGGYYYDGFEQTDNETRVYEIHGCYYHAHDESVCPLTSKMDKDNKDWEETKTIRRERTRKKKEFTESLGIKYIEFYECEFIQMRRNDPELRAFLDTQTPTFYNKHKTSYRVTDNTILNSVVDEELFGAVLVDIHVPAERFEEFKEFSPIFCTTNVPWEVIGETMQTHWSETQRSPDNEVYPFPEQKLLVGGMRARNILLATPLLKFYLEKGLAVTKVHQVTHLV